MNETSKYNVIIANSAEITNLKEIQLLPYGQVKSTNGDFIVDAASIVEVINYFNNKTNDVVVDYEHQTLSGNEAPAAGWIKQLIDKGQEGLWACVEWTQKAADYIAKKEYRYLSPVIQIDADKRVIGLINAGITNFPAIDGMKPLANKTMFLKEDTGMDELIKKLAELLGLEADAKAEEVLAAITARMAKEHLHIYSNKKVLDLLELKEDATVEEVTGQILALKNPSGVVSAAEFAALKEKLQDKETAELVDSALKAGKVTQANLDWARQYAMKDPGGFAEFVKTATPIVPFGEHAGGKTPKAQADGIQVSINKVLGISPASYEKYTTKESE